MQFIAAKTLATFNCLYSYRPAMTIGRSKN